MIQDSDQCVDERLRADLAQGDAMLGSLGPILRHLLANDDNSLFSDEIVARVRGMLSHIAGQLLHAQVEAESVAPVEADIELHRDAVIGELLASTGLLSHVHALALEWQLAERLQSRAGLDPVLSPLLQELIASGDAETASVAMRLLAAQARFAQSQRRMELPLFELPGDLLHAAIGAVGGLEGAAKESLRAQFDEGQGRIGILSRLLIGMGDGAVAALSLGHAGVALFATAVSIRSGQGRDLAILSTNERQLARLVLCLRVAGLSPAAIAEQLLSLHPGIALPEGLDQLSAKEAAALLAASGSAG